MVLAGNEIVMGAVSRLSPVDVQVSYGGGRVSAYSMAKALSKVEKYFGTKTVDEAPYPWRAMADKIDPIILEDWSTSLREIASYASEILRTAKYEPDKIETILKALVFTDMTHSFVIHRERAKLLGLNISDNNEDSGKLQIMREWLGEYAFVEGTTHFIRFITPKRSKGDANKREEVTDEKGTLKPKKDSKRD